MPDTRIARGYLQREAYEKLLRGEKVHRFSHDLRGKARTYKGRYDDSFFSLLDRMKSAGIIVELVELGPRGGLGSALYAVVGRVEK
jgi:hypothetical protein